MTAAAMVGVIMVATRLTSPMNGTANVTAGNTSDSGTWRPADQGYCTTWATIRAGQERCFSVTKAGNTFKVANPDGSLSGYFTSIK